MKIYTPFNGFSKDTFLFLSDLKDNNYVEWFHNNRPRYQTALVKPAKSFINEIGQFLNQLNPEIRTEPNFNKTIMRINNDMRFTKGDPYRTYFLIHFGRFKMDSEFFIYFAPNEIQIGLFINNTVGDSLFFKENSEKYRKEIIDLLEKYKINNNYDLFALNKNPVLIKKKFSGPADFQKISAQKRILLQIVKLPSKSKIFSANFIPEAIKIFLQLYPLYCFAISPFPLKLMNDFKDSFE